MLLWYIVYYSNFLPAAKNSAELISEGITSLSPGIIAVAVHVYMPGNSGPTLGIVNTPPALPG